jgi:hypothetical protein
MSSYDGLQVVQHDGSQQRHHEAPIPALQNSYENEPQIRVEKGDGTPSGKSILGMRRKIFWVVLAILVVVIVAAVVGGIVGSLANNKGTPSSGHPVTQRLVHHSVFTYFMHLLHLGLRESSSDSATRSTASRTSATSSASTPSASTPIPTTSGYTGCPDVNSTIFTASSGAKFMQYCNYDIVSSTEINFDDQATQNLDDCINLCDGTNTRNKNTGCKAVTYNFAGLDFLLCWLKNGTGTLKLDSLANTVGNYSVSAVLQ